MPDSKRVIRKGAVTISAITVMLLATCFTLFFKHQSTTFGETHQRLVEKEKLEIDLIRDNKWEIIISELSFSMKEAEGIGKDKVFNFIEPELNKIDNLEYWFDNFHLDNNPIVNVLHDSVEGTYLSKPTDSNDPFIVIVNINGEPILAVDLSKECAVFTEDGLPKRTRTFEEEYPQHANIPLAKYTFPGIANHRTYSLDNPFFFEFNGELIGGKKTASPIMQYNLTGLYDLYKYYEGDWQTTLKYYEFQVPVYLYDHRDILQNPKVTTRGYINNDTKIIIYVMSYKLYDYIDINPRVMALLARYTEQEETTRTFYKAEKQALLQTINTSKTLSIIINVLVALSMLLIMNVLKEE